MLKSLSVLVENRAGVLNRVSSLFARRGYNIESLAVGVTQDPAISRITITLRSSDEQVNQIIRQLHKLPDVLLVRHLSPDESFSRELVFIKVKAEAASRAQILQIIDIFRGHVIDVSPTTLTIELSGKEDKIFALEGMLEPYGILELVRTGPIAIERGVRAMNVMHPENE
ncbi:MAG: acetolactate synthase small subunit [Saccharofermentanales bacterium]|mgnify:FL=1|jgi:acetolactate synthase-1/3 small subunit|nr:acetolactate synthase small subunit [Clostridiaceae bacterium]